MSPPLKELVRKALIEDLGDGDITTGALVADDLMGVGRLIAKEDLILAGIGAVEAVFSEVDPRVNLEWLAAEGQKVSNGSTILVVAGPYASLLKAERVALNFLQRLSGIATLTGQYKKKCAEHKLEILDTRKTTPLLRDLEKAAVRAGGGRNHRFGLFDGILIKENHIAACGGDIGLAVSRARELHPNLTVIVEAQRVDQIEDAVAAGADRVLLDNMDDAAIRRSLRVIGGRAETEVSGGVTPDRIEALGRMGVDFVSVGALTHSAKAADMSLLIEPNR